MDYQIVVADPAGNITVFVLDDIDPKDFIPLSQKIMAIPELRAEQVGYLKPPLMGGEARLEMMGGEFCGNATRSFGMLTAHRMGKRGKAHVLVECSGSADLLPVDVDFDAGEAETVMPKPVKVESQDAPGLCALTLVFFEGILHVIAPDLQASEVHFNQIRNLIEPCFPFDALGVMFYDTVTQFLTPAVYVKNTDSLVFESSCGSGTVATSVWLSLDLTDGKRVYPLKQPGGVLKATVKKEHGVVTEVRMGGPVTLGKKQCITL